jgi:Kef-type K+ transport system membrane component KefB
LDISLQILLFVAVLILLAKAAGGLCHRVNMPLVLGELLAGVILGPTLVDIWRFSWFANTKAVAGVHPISLPAAVHVLAQIGVVILMLLAGLETDTELMKATAAPAFWAATGGVLLPLAGGAALVHGLGFGWTESVFVGTVLTATSVSITAQTLMNMNRLKSKAGTTILGAAVIDDVLGLIVLSIVIAVEFGHAHASGSVWSGAGLVVGRILAFCGLAFLLGPRLIKGAFKYAKHFKGPHTAVAVALGIAFLFAFAAEAGGGMAAITGSYLAGVFMATNPARSEVIEEIRSMSNALFGPLFFCAVGLEINAWDLGGKLNLFLVVMAIAIVGKVIGCGVGALSQGFSRRESLVVGVGMIPRGEVGLITASIGWAAGVIRGDIYSLLVIVVLATTLITPVLLKFTMPARPENGAVQEPALVTEMAEGS